MLPGARRTALALCTVFLIPGAAGAQSTVFVDADALGGAGDGASWCDAYLGLQDAMTAARDAGGAITEIRVANGVYKPGSATFGTFLLIEGTAQSFTNLIDNQSYLLNVDLSANPGLGMGRQCRRLQKEP